MASLGDGDTPETNVFYDRDADLDLVRARRVAVVGYGNQGRAHALNLADSGCTVRVGLRDSSVHRGQVLSDGLQVDSIGPVVRWADLVSLMLPERVHGAVMREVIAPGLVAGDMLLVAHGFSIRYGDVVPPAGVDVAMAAPVGPGSMLRRLFTAGSGIPALVAVWNDATGTAHEVALSYAAALGCTRAGVVQTTFREETETDLFGEQAVLCGGLTELARAGFDTLVEAGYRPELAYFECVHQIKLIADLMYEGGLASMHRAISDTAEFGDRVSGPRVIDAHVRVNMRAVLADIQDGTFARRWQSEMAAGMPTLEAARRAEAESQVEATGARLRSMAAGAGDDSVG